jgi:hypothetical protein
MNLQNLTSKRIASALLKGFINYGRMELSVFGFATGLAVVFAIIWQIIFKGYGKQEEDGEGGEGVIILYYKTRKILSLK